MSGIMEIILIVVIVLGIIMLPKLMAGKPERYLPPRKQGFKFTGRMRFAILASLLWPALVALFLEPWNGQWAIFFYVAVGPVALIWGIYWVSSGFRKEKTR